MISEYGIRKVHRLVLLPVDYPRVYLGVLDRAVSQQFRHGVQVRSEGEHHRCEGVAACMIGDMLPDSCRLRPLFQVLVHVTVIDEVAEHIIIKGAISFFGHPFQCLS